MIYLQLAWEFFRTGLFAIGGGLATVPFLMDMINRRHWFTLSELTNMIAISESTPGPVGVNMATYVGYTTGGIPGALVATLFLTLPSFVIIMVISGFLERFRTNRIVDAVLFGMRSGCVGLLIYVCYTLLKLVILPETGFHWLSLAIVAVTFALMQIRQLKKLHPVVWVLLGAVLGIILQL